MSEAKVQELVRSRESQRPTYIYEIPLSLKVEMKTLGLRELTANEELAAAKLARGDAFKTANELVKASLVEVDGKPVNVADGSADQAWNLMPAPVRNLVLDAYQELHAPPKGALEDFRKSRKVRVG